MDNFITYCRKIHAEPLIEVNLMGWAPNEQNGDNIEECMTAQDAADLVTYLNGKKGLHVKYFQMEMNLSFGMRDFDGIGGKCPARPMNI
jgi:alpha-L-arabinofuranosidase